MQELRTWFQSSPYSGCGTGSTGMGWTNHFPGKEGPRGSRDRMYTEAPSLATRDFPGLAVFLCVQVP